MLVGLPWKQRYWQVGVKLSDNIVTSSGVKIGYDALDGKSWLFLRQRHIQVKAEFQTDFVTRKFALPVLRWRIVRKIGDKVEYQIGYKNLSVKRSRT